MCERSLGVEIQGIVDTVGPVYGREVLHGLLGLMEDLAMRGLLVCGSSDQGQGMSGARAKGQVTMEDYPGYARVYVAVTDDCNLACATCYRGAREDDAPKEVVLSTIRNMAMFRPKELIITGGEPTLRADIIELLEIATGVAPRVILATNATLLTEAMAEAIAALGIGVQVSIDSADEIAHDMVRGRGSFRAARQGLDALARAGVDQVELVATVVDSAAFDLESMILFAEKHGASFHASLFQEVGRGACLRLREQGGSSADLARSMLKYLLRACKGNSLHEQASFDEVMGLVPKEGCGAGSKVLGVSGRGNAYPCHLLMLPEFRVELNQVPIRHRPISCEVNGTAGVSRCAKGSVWRVPTVDEIEDCRKCDVRYFCGGGCRAAAYSASGSLGGRDPMCEAYRIFISSILWTWDDSRMTSENLARAMAEVTTL